MPLVIWLFFQPAGDGVMVIYGFHSHSALQGSQLAMVWPVTSMHQLCLSFPSLNAGWVYCQCHRLHTPVSTLGGASCYFVFTGDPR